MFAGINTNQFDDPNFKEDSVRETIITPILTKLGYGPTGDTRVIRSKVLRNRFIRIGTTNHPVTTIPDYTLVSNERPIFILDAKGPAENVQDVDNVQQAYSYAIHPEVNCKEFGLCNGRQLVVYGVESPEPKLLLDFEEFELRWCDIEKQLLPKYLLAPALRNFAPDFGTKLQRLGVRKDTKIVMLGVRLNTFSRIDANLITAASNTDFCGEAHCVSFDFPSPMLDSFVSALPVVLRERFCDAMNRAPFQAVAGLAIEVDVTVQLGEAIQGQTESFVPLLIKEVRASRFNPSEVEYDESDVPPHVFQLRQHFQMNELNK